MPNPVTTIYSSDGEVIKTFTAFKFEKVSIDKIPDYLKKAIIATEDKILSNFVFFSSGQKQDCYRKWLCLY